MKAFIFIPFALLLGLLIGSWPLRSEVAQLNAELEDAKSLLKKRPNRAGSMNDVTSLLGIERLSPTAPNAVTPPSKPNAPEASDPQASNHPPELASSPPEALPEASTNPAPEVAMNMDIDNAVELWKLRVDVARSTFVSNAQLNDEQELEFDVLVEAMNLRIGDTIDNFAEQLRDAEEVQMEAGVRIMNEITETIVMTYDELDKSLPAKWRESSGERFSLIDFVDPEVARPLTDVQDKLDNLSGDAH